MRSLVSALLLILATASAGQAAVALRFAPADQTVPTGNNATLSVMVDEAIAIRTVELTVTYDPAILTSLEGDPGQLFLGSGCSLFPDFQDDTPGQWYGACVALGFNCWVTGPGELYRWTFNGTNPGTSPITAIQVRLYDPAANVIADVTLPPTTVRVGEGTASPPPPAPGLGLELAPNPFNPSCRITLSGGAGPARLEIFDLAGRCLAAPWQGELAASERSFTWEALDASGRPLPSGVYLFRLSDGTGAVCTRRGTLLK